VRSYLHGHRCQVKLTWTWLVQIGFLDKVVCNSGLHATGSSKCWARVRDLLRRAISLIVYTQARQSVYVRLYAYAHWGDPAATLLAFSRSPSHARLHTLCSRVGTSAHARASRRSLPLLDQAIVWLRAQTYLTLLYLPLLSLSLSLSRSLARSLPPSLSLRRGQNADLHVSAGTRFRQGQQR